MKKSLSIVIAARNCEDRIEGTIRPWLGVAEEIIVVDQNSADKTVEKAKTLNAKIIINEPKDGNFDLNRKLGIQNAKSDWILYIDTDERPTVELLDEITIFLNSKDSEVYSGVRIPNKFYFIGKELSHGIYNHNSAEIRLFKKESWNYNCEEGYHRSVNVSGEVKKFKHSYKHFNVNSLSEWFEKTNQYTELDALKKYKLQKSRGRWAAIDALKFFLKYYIIKKGFRDGMHGFVATVYFMLYHFTLQMKIWEKETIEKLTDEKDYLSSFKKR